MCVHYYNFIIKAVKIIYAQKKMNFFKKLLSPCLSESNLLKKVNCKTKEKIKKK